MEATTDRLDELLTGAVNPVLPFFERAAPFAEVDAVISKCDPFKSGDFRSGAVGFAGFWREDAIRKFGFSIPCIEAVRAIAAGSPLVEVGAGSGYWTRLLKAAGADVVVTDIGEGQQGNYQITVGEDVTRLSAQDAVKKWPERNVFVSWPSYEMSWAFEMARLIQSGRTLFYIGEGNGGCTADDRFHRLMDREFHEAATIRIPQWPGIHDRLYVMVRK